MEKITVQEIKEATDWLMTEKQGCWHKKTGYFRNGDPICFVIGWEDYGEHSDSKYSDGNYEICCKIAVNNSSLQCDYDWDFQMPYNEETSEVDDTDCYVGDNFEDTVKWLNDQAERVVLEWGDNA